MAKKALSIFLALLVIAASAACGVVSPVPPDATATVIEASQPEGMKAAPAEQPQDNSLRQYTAMLPLEPSFTTIAGIITDFKGTVDESGDIPWYIDWFQFKIETGDGTSAIVIGLHETYFCLGAAPEVGQSIVAYIPRFVPDYAKRVWEGVPCDTPGFVVDRETVYIASAIIGGVHDVVVCGFRREGDGYVSNDGSFRFVVDGNTKLKHAMRENPWVSHIYESWDSFVRNGVFDGKPWGDGVADLAVFYKTDADGVAVATTVVALSDTLPLVSSPEGESSPARLAAADYLFTMEDFETLNLPILLNGKTLGQSAIVGMGGVYVPFRPIFLFVGYGDYAYIDNGGKLNFGGGGAGSENSYWCVGEPFVWHMGGSMPLDVPPIIVDGIIFVSLRAFFAGAARFCRAWVFDDRIEIWKGNYDPFEPGFGTFVGERLSGNDSVATMPIVVNGVYVDADAEYIDNRDIFVPLAPIAKALDIRIEAAITESKDEVQTASSPMMGLQELIWLCMGQGISIGGIVLEGEVLIYEWESLLSHCGVLPE